MNFSDAIQEGTIKVLLKSKKNLVFGLEVTNVGSKIYEKFPSQVFETPVSELASSGLAVGLATQGFKPQVVFGRVEFALLAFDQIFTQAGRWEYMFGGNYPCPVNFRVQIGRQWGNGPQHTANYHSIFMQSYGLDIFIPSTPEEAYLHTLYSNQLNNPSVILEHRYLTQINQNFKKKLHKITQHTLYKNNNKKKNYLIITYGDSLIDSLKAKKILNEERINVDILNFSYFPFKNRIQKQALDLAKHYKKIIFFDSAPFEFGILSGISSLLKINKKKKQKFYYLSPKNEPSPSAPFLAKNYYKTFKDIVNLVSKIEVGKKIYGKKLSFDDVMLWPKDDIKDLI
jgi:pyruvate/2-oxoglutarate/acetoin dehydrogenase E1 component